jgi:DNA (cytosine-5)-methyltransferase 1
MQGTQLSFFPNEENHSTTKQKKPKLGRYERIKRELDQNDSDPYKIFIDIDTELSLLNFLCCSLYFISFDFQIFKKKGNAYA